MRVFVEGTPGMDRFSSQHMQKILDTFHVETPEFRAVSLEVKCEEQGQRRIDLVQVFEKVWAPEEVYFATALSPKK